ncbi:unnamed protein product, partial [Didymodactylos carnosus]
DSNPIDRGVLNDRISKLEYNVNQLNDNLQRLIDVNNKLFEQQKQTQDLSMNLGDILHIQQIDTSFHHDFISQFVTPVCQTVIEALPLLVKQKMISDSTPLCSTFTKLCEKLSCELPKWMTRFNENDEKKRQFHLKEQQQGAIM